MEVAPGSKKLVPIAMKGKDKVIPMLRLVNFQFKDQLKTT